MKPRAIAELQSKSAGPSQRAPDGGSSLPAYQLVFRIARNVSNRIIAGSLTREYLQHEVNQALLKFAEKGNTNAVVVPAGTSMSPLISVPAGK